MLALRVFQSVICFMLLFIFISVTPTVHAENGQTYHVGTTNLNVRTTPSDSGQIIGQLGYGNKVIVFKEAYGWAQTYYNGQEAWVASHYLYLDDERQQVVGSNQATVTVTANDVRIRAGSGTTYNIVGSTSSGESFQLLETTNDWHKITLDNGSTGWIAAWLTDSSSDTSTKKSESNIEVISPTAIQSNKSLKGYNIVLDPGHGGRDPGAIGLDGSFEKNLTLSTATIVAQKLRDAGATVIMTRSNDRFLSLNERVSISNSYDTHAFISIHYDAYPIYAVNGFSTHYYSSFGRDRQLAQSIQTGIAQYVNLNSRGIMQDNYYVLRENKDLAVLVELGFMTNAYDLETVQTVDYQHGVAEGITSGLLNYFHR